jgi:hypothetical protein
MGRFGNPVSMRVFVAVTVALLAISLASTIYAAQILSMKTWSTVGGQVYIVTGDTAVTAVYLPYALADSNIAAQPASVDLTPGAVTNGYTSITQGDWILKVDVEFKSTATDGTYIVTVYRTPKDMGPERQLVGSISCNVVKGANPSDRTVSFYYDYGSGDVPASTGLLITVEKTP